MMDAMDTTAQKVWVTLVVDDKPVGIMIDGSAQHEKEVNRLLGYHGVRWRRATDDDLKQFRQTIIDYQVKRQKAAEKRAANRGE